MSTSEGAVVERRDRAVSVLLSEAASAQRASPFRPAAAGI